MNILQKYLQLRDKKEIDSIKYTYEDYKNLIAKIDKTLDEGFMVLDLASYCTSIQTIAKSYFCDYSAGIYGISCYIKLSKRGIKRLLKDFKWVERRYEKYVQKNGN